MKLTTIRHKYGEDLPKKIFSKIQNELYMINMLWVPGSYDELDVVDYAIDVAEDFDGVEADYGPIVEISNSSSTIHFMVDFELYIGEGVYEQELTFAVIL